MPLIRPRTRRIRVFRHISRLQEPNRDVLLAYAKFINESPDYVLNQLIETTLARDRDFVTWRAAQGDAPAPEGRHASDGDLDPGRPEGATR
jgi:hypothetical protein